jgi:MFS family permease
MIPKDRNRVAEDVLGVATKSHSPSDRQMQLAVVALLVFASGCAALVFQVGWMRELRLIFGATTAAVAAVLAIFMAGLGIGSAVLGRRADRAANPLQMYGLLEVAIALSVAATPPLISLIGSIYTSLDGQEALGVTRATLLRLTLAVTIMAIPTFLMGGTLPAAVRAVTSSSDVHRRALGILYGSNTLGAVAGAAAATFFALEYLGTRWTLWTGCAIGLTAGAIAIGYSRTFLLNGALRDEAVDAESSTTELDTTLGETRDTDVVTYPWLIYLAAAVLGFTFLRSSSCGTECWRRSWAVRHLRLG